MGWGRATGSRGIVVTPDSDDEWRRLLASAGERGVTPRGAGSGYGDCAHNAGGHVANTRRPAAIDLDPASGVVTVDAGTTLGEIMRATAPQGWIAPVMPGTGEVTVGGAIAADVHGKNHPHAGAFGAHVEELALMTPRGELVNAGPARRPDVFWATVGGLGLTGVIRRARLRLRPVTTAWMATTDRIVEHLDEAMARLADIDSPYRVAWLDAYRSGQGLGGGVVSTSRHLDLAELPPRLRPAARHYPPVRSLPLPDLPYRGVVTPAVVRAANRAHLAAARLRRGERRVRLAWALHPLDSMRGWPGLYGSRGLVQYQFVVPPGAADVIGSALVEAQRAGCVPSLAVLKRLGDADAAPLSFPGPGWTLALDFPARLDRLRSLLDNLDKRVVTAGGRVYLVKDARLQPDLLGAMYPRLAAWRAVRDELDPDHVMTSDLDRRLDLSGRRLSR